VPPTVSTAAAVLNHAEERAYSVTPDMSATRPTLVEVICNCSIERTMPTPAPSSTCAAVPPNIAN